MSVVGSVFVAVGESAGQMTESLGEVAGTEVMALDGESVHRRMRASTVDEWFGVVAQPNRYVEPDPAPGARLAPVGHRLSELISTCE
jgi:hypothetical protein